MRQKSQRPDALHLSFCQKKEHERTALQAYLPRAHAVRRKIVTKNVARKRASSMNVILRRAGQRPGHELLVLQFKQVLGCNTWRVMVHSTSSTAWDIETFFFALCNF